MRSTMQAQATEVAAIKAKAQPGQLGDFRVVGLRRQSSALLEGAGDDDVGEFVANLFQQAGGQPVAARSTSSLMPT